MTRVFVRGLAAVLAAAVLPVAALADGVSVRFDDQASPFPSNRLTVLDFSNATYRRVNLPKPDCAVRVSDCADIDVINTLDGFSTQPRITVPFTGDIDVSTVNSDTVFLVNLGDTQTLRGFGEKVGINQILWDPASKTLVFEPDELLAERSRYVLAVTNGVRDARGKRIKTSDYMEDDVRDRWDRRFAFGHHFLRHRDDQAYQRELRDGLRHIRGRTQVVAGALFTTQTSTSDLVKVMRQIKHARPAPADFMIGNSDAGPVRAVFPLTGLAAMQFTRQISTAPGCRASSSQ